MIYRKSPIISEDFTGLSGLYCYVTPKHSPELVEIQASLLSLQHESFVEVTPLDDYHCTIMYSKESEHEVLDVNKFVEGFTKKTEFTVAFKRFDMWQGHNDDYYFGIIWSGDTLRNLHYRLKNEFHCQSSFDEYLCHTTIATVKYDEAAHLEKIKIFNNILIAAQKPQRVVFTNLTIANCRQD